MPDRFNVIEGGQEKEQEPKTYYWFVSPKDPEQLPAGHYAFDENTKPISSLFEAIEQAKLALKKCLKQYPNIELNIKVEEHIKANVGKPDEKVSAKNIWEASNNDTEGKFTNKE